MEYKYLDILSKLVYKDKDNFDEVCSYFGYRITTNEEFIELLKKINSGNYFNNN